MMDIYLVIWLIAITTWFLFNDYVLRREEA